MDFDTQFVESLCLVGIVFVVEMETVLVIEMGIVLAVVVMVLVVVSTQKVEEETVEPSLVAMAQQSTELEFAELLMVVAVEY